MKVYIGPYVEWIGPYQIADKIPFLSEDSKEKVGDFLDKTWVRNVCEWFYSKQERKIKVRLEKYDTWNVDSTLSPVILPLLKQLKETKRGSAYVDDEDLPTTMRYSNPNENGVDNWVHHKWDWVLDEMIWAFEQLNDPEWEEKFYHGTPEYETTEEEDNDYGPCFRIKQTNPDYWVDYEGMKLYNERIINGTRLFGKYYQNLWS